MQLKKILYHHLPKCYGHTVRSIHDQIDDQLYNNPEIRVKIPRFFHIPLEHLTKVVLRTPPMIWSANPLNEQQLNERKIKLNETELLDSIDNHWFIFTFVRHPYDRIVSVWNFFQEQREFNPILMDQKNGNKLNQNPEDPRRMTFSKKVAADFLKLKYGDLNEFLKDEEYFSMFMNSHDFLWFNTMTSFCNGKWESYDKIYKCEDFENEIYKYLNDIGIQDKVKITVEKTNVSKKDFELNELTEESKDIIYKFYKEDFDNLEYKR